jgi:hypothetical protein
MVDQGHLAEGDKTQPMKLRIIPLVIVLLSSLLAAAPVHANVRLTYFELEQGPSSSQLVVKWGTETETNTAGFRIRRGTNANPSQATDIHTEPARGSATTGYDYQYVDSGLTTGQVYYYWLQELETSGGLKDLGNKQATAGGGTATPTPTAGPATATPLPPTATPAPPTATPVPPASQAPAAATATQRPTQAAATATSQPAAAPPSAALSTPATGVTPASLQPAVTDPFAAPVAPAVEEQEKEAAAAAAVAAALGERGEDQRVIPQDPAPESPTAEGESAPEVDPLSANQAPETTATPQMLAEASQAPLDAPQAQLVRPTATPRPSGASDGDDNTSSLLMVIGGGSLCGAALLVLVVFFVWRRR